MKRTLSVFTRLMLVAATALLAGCGIKIFEDIGSDPHPPSATVISVARYTPPAAPATADRVSARAQTRVVQWNSNGFTLRRGELFEVGVSYSDPGVDILKFQLIDLDGALSAELTPIDPPYFPGATGTAVGPAAGIEMSGIAGPHRLQLWAEDSNGSRSEKVEFVITFVL